MAGLAILKHTFNLSDEELVRRWVENPYFQFFCGEEHFRHKPPFDRSSMTRWRQRMGMERLDVLLQRASRSPSKPRRSHQGPVAHRGRHHGARDGDHERTPGACGAVGRGGHALQ
jgi:hypothetical protein